MKRTLKTLLAALAASLLALPATAADKLDQWINFAPKDTIGIVAFKDVPAMMTNWHQSGSGKFIQDEETQRWMAPMKKDGQYVWDKYLSESYGMSLEQLVQLAKGSVIGFVSAKDADSFDKKDGIGWGALMDIGDGEAAVRDLKAKILESRRKEHPDYKETTEEIQGTQVTVLLESGEADAAWVDAHAIVDGTFLVAGSKEMMEHLLTALKSGGEAPAEVRDHLARVMQIEERRADFTAYANGTRLIALAREGLTKAMEKDKAKKKDAAPNPFGDITAAQIFDALGLGELNAAAITGSYTEGQEHSSILVLHAENPTGMLSWIRPKERSVELVPFLPAGLLSAEVGRFDFGTLYDGILATIMKLSPQMGMMGTMYLAGFEAQNGFKIRDDFLGSLADELFTVQDTDGKVTGTAFGIKVKNAEKLGTAITALKTMSSNAGFAAFEEVDYLGYAINTLKMSKSGEAAEEMAFCNTGKYLIFSVGSQNVLRKVLGRMKDPAGPSVWDSERVQSMLALLPKEFHGMAVTDPSRAMTTAFNALELIAKQAASKRKTDAAKKGPGKGPAKDGDGEDVADEAFKGFEQMLDPKSRPSDETFKKYFGTMLQAHYALPDAIQVRYLNVPVEAK